MNFLAVLNYEHLDNGMFLTAFAKSMSQQKSRGIILHGDSEYTERIIQTGVMRQDATIRSIKDLNHRLIALLADHGVSTIGVNGYQKSLVTVSSGNIQIDKGQIEKLPDHPMLLISSLVFNSDNKSVEPVSISDLAFAFQDTLNIKTVTVFSKKESVNIMREDLPKRIDLNRADTELLNAHVPNAFQSSERVVFLTTPNLFGSNN